MNLSVSRFREQAKTGLQACLSQFYNMRFPADFSTVSYAECIKRFPGGLANDFINFDKEDGSLPSPPNGCELLDREIYRLSHDRLTLTSNGVPYVDNEILWAGYSPAIGYVKRATAFSKKTIQIKGSVTAFWPNQFLSYGDFILSLIPRVCCLKSILTTDEWKQMFFVIGVAPPEYLYQFFESLGITRDQILYDTSVKYDCREATVYISNSMQFHCHAPNPEELKATRETFSSLQNNDGGKKFIIHRGSSDRRQLASDSTWRLEELREQGYEDVNPGELTFTEQVSLFSQASALAGVHGAGMGNVMWARPEVSVEEWFHPGYCWSCFRLIRCSSSKSK